MKNLMTLSQILLLFLISSFSVHKLITEPQFRCLINFIFTSITVGSTLILGYMTLVKLKVSKIRKK